MSVVRVYMQRGEDAMLKNFRKRESALAFFREQEHACGNGTPLKDCGTHFDCVNGVCKRFLTWKNGDRIELIYNN